MSLELRRELFSKFSFTDSVIDRPLLKSGKISQKLFHNLQISTKVYLWYSAECPDCSIDDILQYYTDNKDLIHTITPNGLIVPKKQTLFSYNQFCSDFYKIVMSAGLDKPTTCWNLPLNLRVKFGQDIKTPLSSSNIHSDAWLNECIYCGTAMIGILGDVNNNYVKFWEPPDHFKDEWLLAKSYQEGLAKIDGYTEVQPVSVEGCITISDFSVIHASTLNAGASTRASIDTVFGIKQPNETDLVRNWRSCRISNQDFKDIGTKRIFYPEQSYMEMVDSHGGLNPVTKVSIRDIKEI